MPISVRTPRSLAGVAAPLRVLVRAALAGEGRRASEIAISLADDALLRELNRSYRGLDRATDVLSFRYHERDGDPVEGDIVISLDRMAEQARRFRKETAQIEREEGRKVTIPGEFLDAIAHLPECGGIALGVDRLVKLICNTSSIRDVLPFPEDIG